MKIAVIGGGSTYAPELLEGLINEAKEKKYEEVVLYDIWEERLKIVGDFCIRMAKAADSPLKITTTNQIEEALLGATFVITQIRVGGWQGRHQDILTGIKHGLIGQETTGVGGFAKALRTIPVMLDIGKKIEQYAPDAWLINFTNPSSIITETMIKYTSVKTVGLCNVPIEMQIEIGKSLGVSEDKVRLSYAGLNHLGWVMDVFVDGKSRMDEVMQKLKSGSGPANIPEFNYPDLFWEALNMIPSPYLRYFYATDYMLDKIRSNPLTRAEEVSKIEEKLLKIYHDPSQNKKPKELEDRGGAWYSKIAVELMSALTSKNEHYHIINTLNKGTIPQLEPDAVIEVSAKISQKGVIPMELPKIPASILGLIMQVKCYESLTVEAGVKRDKKKALLALVNHPLIPTVEVAQRLLDHLITARGYDLQ